MYVLAGSRLYMFELLTTRVSILGVLYVLGFTEASMNVYIIVVGFQAVFNHANVAVPSVFARAPLKWLIVTPDFHHWHHSSEREAIDRNYAAHFAFLDYLFGTAVKSDRRFPGKYGVLGDYMPKGWLRQQLFPFTWKHCFAARGRQSRLPWVELLPAPFLMIRAEIAGHVFLDAAVESSAVPNRRQEVVPGPGLPFRGVAEVE